MIATSTESGDVGTSVSDLREIPLLASTKRGGVVLGGLDTDRESWRSLALHATRSFCVRRNQWRTGRSSTCAMNARALGIGGLRFPRKKNACLRQKLFSSPWYYFSLLCVCACPVPLRVFFSNHSSLPFERMDGSTPRFCSDTLRHREIGISALDSFARF